MKARNICNGILLLMILATAATATVNVVNPSFEVPSGALPNSCPGTNCSYSVGSFTGWTLSANGDGGQFNPGNPANTQYFNSIPDGVKVGYVNTGSLTQNVGVVTTAGAFYTLSVDLGWRKDVGSFSGTAQLVIGSNVINVSGTAPTQGNFSTFTATYLSVSADVGSTISLVLTNNGEGGQADFDSVVLTEVADAFQIQYISHVTSGGVVNFTNSGSSRHGNAPGNICVNVYVFDPQEELIECCSCPVTANGLASLEAADLIHNNLTPATPASIVVKLVATLVDGRNATCDPGTAGSNKAPLASGLRAWATALHSPTVAAGGALITSEDEFLNGSLSAAELNHLTTFCGFIEANGSGHGICPTCAPGALAGAKQ